MVIIKDIEMPKSCKKCPMSHPVFGDGWETWCSLTKKNVATPNHRCPLTEVVTCKDCKHNGTMYCKCFMCDGNEYMSYHNPNFFCADGERKE